MKSSRAFLLVLAGFCLLFNSCTKKEKLPQALYKKWTYSSVLNAEGKAVKQVDSNDYMIIGSDKSFEYHLFKENIHATGSWELVKDTLVYSYNTPDTTLSVDSLVYRSNNGKSEAELFHEGSRLGAFGEKGLQLVRKVRRFHIQKFSADELVIEENGIKFSYRYIPLAVSGTVSAIGIGRGILGVTFLLFVAWIFSINRKRIDWKLVGAGVLMQVLFAVAVLKVSFVKAGFEKVAEFFVVVLDFTRAGSQFLFGGLVSDPNTFGFIFAFQVLPTVIFFSALSTLLYYLGILQKIVYSIAWVMSKTMRLSGAESLSAAANIFLGQTEAPLLVKPYIEKMTRSELLCIMVGGMATIAGGVLAAYVGFLGGPDPEQQKIFATHLLTASIMSAPAAILISKMLVPETEEIREDLVISKEKTGTNVLDAISIGTTDGLKLAVNVGAMLLVFTALMYMLNFIFLNGIGEWTGLNETIKTASSGRYEGLTLQYLMGYIFSPIAWITGVSSQDMVVVGQLLGEKTILNEFYAYTTLGTYKEAGAFMDPKSIIIATYALCGFANFASIGIQIGGIGTLAPNKRSTLSSLGLTALLGGTLACLLTGAIVGMLY